MANLRTRIVLRNDTTANWLAAQSVVLLKGEVGVEFTLDGKTKLKIGDGIKTWAELDYFGCDFESVEAAIAALQSDVAKINEVLFPSAEGSQTLLSRVETLESEVAGVDQKITDSINAFAEKISDDGTVNTLKELVDYVAEHGAETASLVADVKTLQDLVGETSVAEQIGATSTSLLEEINRTEEKLKAFAVGKKYEITNVPVGTLVDYRDKEIRVMCPADATFTKQTVGTGGDANTYYMTFKTYAPNDNVVGYIEHINGQSDSEILTNFSIDGYGRRYQPTWLGVAKYDEVAGVWTYYGANSTVSKFIGWDYRIDWYNADGKIIASDSTRINLSNEECHNNIAPYYVSSINVNNLVQDDGDVLIMNGGSAN